MIEHNLEEVEGVSYLTIIETKDRSKKFQLFDTRTGLGFSFNSSQLSKIIENPKTPITTRKAYMSHDGLNSNGQEMVVYFPEKECFMVYIGKPGVVIRNLRTDIATNGELEIKIDLKQIQILLAGVLAHEFAVKVRNKREEERIDYLDAEVLLPEGKWFTANQNSEDK
jgi:hypothetical protein